MRFDLTWGIPIIKRLLLLAVLLTGLAGCALKPYVLNQTADALAVQAPDDEDDLELARDASAFYLKFSESVLRQVPHHTGLSVAVSSAYTQYAYAFVSFEAEKLEQTDRIKSAQMRDRAAKLYSRAHVHAMRALDNVYPGIEQALQQPDMSKWPRLHASHVPLAYWASASLGGWVAMSKDSPEAVANLPMAQRLAEWAWQVDPSFQKGALSGLLATLESARIGGSTAKAKAYVDQAIADAKGESAGAWVTQAEVIAVTQHDPKMFTTSLQQACTIAKAHRSLANEVMCTRAQWLLTQTDELF